MLAALAALVLQACATAPGKQPEKSILDVIDESRSAQRGAPVELCPTGTVSYCSNGEKCTCVNEEGARAWLRNTFNRL
jgi:hypothetical protein